MKREELRQFYPEIKPNKQFNLKVSDLHTIYFASYGNEEGIPVIALHGGPGAGTAPYYAQFFDPEIYHIILADQRGSGQSLPLGELKENTTPDLIADIEKIRVLLNIEQWAVFGGSWGSSLALLYAEQYPERVLGLVLRGICLVREFDYHIFTSENCPAALLHKNDWEKFKGETVELIKLAGYSHLSLATHKIFHIYYELLQHPKNEIKEEAAASLAYWETLNSYLEVTQEDLAWSRSPDGVNMGLTEATYFKDHCYIKENQILDNINQLKGIPVYIVQGKYDLVCPPYQADDLENALRRINNDASLVTRYNSLAGHSHNEPETRHFLILALDDLGRRLENEYSSGLSSFGK